MSDFDDFIERFALFSEKRKDVFAMTLQNIFSMRRIGNKTHGDMAEIAISEFINQYMYDFSSKHVGKDLFRAKEREEDIVVNNDVTSKNFSVSLKAYGVGPLQLSTDKSNELFPKLKQESCPIIECDRLCSVLSSSCFEKLRNLHVMPLIYDEKKRTCNILIFDIDRALSSTRRISYVEPGERHRKHPVFLFENDKGEYIAEVRYGGASANALQRGFWTHTERAYPYFKPVCKNWISYDDNEALLLLFSKAMVASCKGHKQALNCIERDIDEIIGK